MADGEILLVCAHVAISPKLPTDWLDDDERRRLSAYRRDADRRRHHVAHALKRWAIGRILGAAPRELVFVRSAGGKPRLAEGELRFNLSHNGDWIALALRDAVEVGVDVQRGGLLPPWPEISHPDEPALRDADDFIERWALKEAVAKCCGEGLVLDFAHLCLRPLDRPGLFACDDGSRRWHAWSDRLRSDTRVAVASSMAWSSIRWAILDDWPPASVFE